VSECDWIDGAAMFIRAEVFDDVGLLDERFFMYFEEAEFAQRAQNAGWRVGVALDAHAEQTPGEGNRPGAFAYLMSRNGLEYARRGAGALGILAAVQRALNESWSLVRSCVRPSSTREERTSARIKLIATWVGVLDFARRRWGPPPAGLPGLGDTRGTGTRGRDSVPRAR
jgi:GT2 family glycosyltransferase